jgi:hypothetical protein
VASSIVLPPAARHQRVQAAADPQTPRQSDVASRVILPPPFFSGGARILTDAAVSAGETPAPRLDAADASAAPASSLIYSTQDLDVVPPSAIYPRFPSRLPPGLGPKDVAEFYVVVSETGAVESVRARRVPATMAEAMTVTMSLSAAKAWRFKPGMKNGAPVKYQTLVWILKN